jgi:hypothetical protein
VAADLIAEPVCEEGAGTHSRPAIDIDNKCGLNAIALGDKDQVATRPQREVDPSKISLGKVILRSMFVDDDSLAAESATDPLYS